MSRYLHFTLGPVQGFVWQARRTRDFWAGSFLLSYLSGIAMFATRKRGGEIIFPVPQQQFLDAIELGSGQPTHGDVPNRFKAEVPDHFDPTVVVADLKQVWKALAEQVWLADLAPLSPSETTRQIWERQIDHFWEISWAIGDDPNQTDLLDRRKNWRTHCPPPEPGLKCSIMEGWQELSGVEQAQHKQQKEFWKKVRGSKADFDLDIKEGEHLCAIAFVKRRFARIFKEFICQLDGYKVHGWELNPNVPSVALIAATPWLAKAATTDAQATRELIDASHALSDKGAALVNLRLLVEAKQKTGLPASFLRLDGTTLFETILENKRLFDETKAQTMKQILKRLSKTIGTPSPFYAVLQMDGDNFGVHMSNPAKQHVISKSLNRFIASVSDIVDRHSGFLIYAGGEDVQAILPLETALSCALELRTSFEEAMREGGAREAGVDGTISAGVLFAHIKTPLHLVLSKAFDLLYDVAKEQGGRDALAVAILKPGGISATWTQPWAIAIDKGVIALEKLAISFRTQNEQNEMSSGFFFRIREIMDRFEGVGTEDVTENLLAAEYRTGTRLTQAEALELIRPLLHQCRPVKRDASQPASKWTRGPIKVDGALIVRFLAQKGVE
ncbi:MAG: type III-B CRISPR-associated protein Cas10/Cmr2 [Campylobacterales bacterium]